MIDDQWSIDTDGVMDEISLRANRLKYYNSPVSDYAAVPTSLPTLGQGADAAEHIMETALGGPRSGEMVLNASRLQETKT